MQVSGMMFDRPAAARQAMFAAVLSLLIFNDSCQTSYL